MCVELYVGCMHVSYVAGGIEARAERWIAASLAVSLAVSIGQRNIGKAYVDNILAFWGISLSERGGMYLSYANDSSSGAVANLQSTPDHHRLTSYTDCSVTRTKLGVFCCNCLVAG